MSYKPKLLTVSEGGIGTSTTGTSGKTLIGNGSAFIESTPTYPTAAGTSGNILTSDGTNWTSAAPASAGGYILTMINSDSFIGNPADATTYYMVRQKIISVTSATKACSRMYIPQAGTITACYGNVTVIGTLGSAGNSTLSIRLNNTTDTTVTSTLAMSSASNTFNNTGLSIAVSAGDYVQFKLLTPTWGTNPGSVSFSGSILIT